MNKKKKKTSKYSKTTNKIVGETAGTVLKKNF